MRSGDNVALVSAAVTVLGGDVRLTDIDELVLTKLEIDGTRSLRQDECSIQIERDLARSLRGSTSSMTQ
jgi:hypothetical protein